MCYLEWNHPCINIQKGIIFEKIRDAVHGMLRKNRVVLGQEDKVQIRITNLNLIGLIHKNCLEYRRLKEELWKRSQQGQLMMMMMTLSIEKNWRAKI